MGHQEFELVGIVLSQPKSAVSAPETVEALDCHG